MIFLCGCQLSSGDRPQEVLDSGSHSSLYPFCPLEGSRGQKDSWAIKVHPRVDSFLEDE